MVKIKKAICVVIVVSFILIFSQFAFSGTTNNDNIKSGIIVMWIDKSGVHHYSNLLKDKSRGSVYMIESELPELNQKDVKSEGNGSSDDGSVNGNININIKQLAE